MKLKELKEEGYFILKGKKERLFYKVLNAGVCEMYRENAILVQGPADIKLSSEEEITVIAIPYL